MQTEYLDGVQLREKRLFVSFLSGFPFSDLVPEVCESWATQAWSIRSFTASSFGWSSQLQRDAGWYNSTSATSLWPESLSISIFRALSGQIFCSLVRNAYKLAMAWIEHCITWKDRDSSKGLPPTLAEHSFSGCTKVKRDEKGSNFAKPRPLICTNCIIRPKCLLVKGPGLILWSHYVRTCGSSKSSLRLDT